MSRINALISELSQRRVDFRQLGSIGKRNKGTVITATKMKELALATGPIRVFAGGQTVADVQEDAIPQKSIIRVPSIIVRSRGNIGFTYYNKPFTHKTELWSYSIDDPDVDQKFVYYYLLTEVPRLQEVARATSVKLPQLSVKDTDLLRIPVPPKGHRTKHAQTIGAPGSSFSTYFASQSHLSKFSVSSSIFSISLLSWKQSWKHENGSMSTIGVSY
nr:restriction endonuclease subunit S [Corynebacterium ulcerans]